MQMQLPRAHHQSSLVILNSHLKKKKVSSISLIVANNDGFYDTHTHLTHYESPPAPPNLQKYELINHPNLTHKLPALCIPPTLYFLGSLCVQPGWYKGVQGSIFLFFHGVLNLWLRTLFPACLLSPCQQLWTGDTGVPATTGETAKVMPDRTFSSSQLLWQLDPWAAKNLGNLLMPQKTNKTWQWMKKTVLFTQ